MLTINNKPLALVSAVLICLAMLLVTACGTGTTPETPTQVTTVATESPTAAQAPTDTAVPPTATTAAAETPTESATPTEAAMASPTQVPSAATPGGGPADYTWSQIALAQNQVQEVTVLSSAGNIALAVGQKGAWRAAYPYKTWDALKLELQGRTATAAIASADVMYITSHTGCASGAPISAYRSTDGGNSWQAINGGTAPLRVVATNVSTAYGLTCSGVVKSEDSGATWTTLPGSHVENYDPSAIAIGPDGQSLVVAYYSEGGSVRIMRSDESVQKWTDVTPKSQELRAPVIFAVAPTKEGQPEQAGIYMTTAPGNLWLLADGATDWKPIQQSNPQSAKPGADFAISALYVDTNNSEQYNKPGPIIYEARVQQGAESAQGLGIYRSADGGQTWQLIGKGLDKPIVNSIALAPHDPSGDPNQVEILLAATDNGVWSIEMPPPFH